MSLFKIFTSLSFPTAAIGAGIQMKKDNEKVAVEGSNANWQTFYSILLWVVELAALWFAAIFTGLIQAQVTYLEEYDHSDHLRSSIMFNTIAFYSRAIVVSAVVLINLGSCSSPGLARAVQQTICCGDMWTNKRSRQSRSTCLGLFWLLEQISFCLPAFALVLMSNNGISGVLSKQCLQQGDSACDSTCAFRYAPWDSFSKVEDGTAFSRPITALFMWSYILYFSSMFIRVFRTISIFLCLRTIVGNNATSHQTIGSGKGAVNDAVNTALGRVEKFSNIRKEITYGFEKSLRQRNHGAPLRADLNI
ncbi:MAG: hypothetical protein CMH46_00585 [Muricauda sp.]|nr:hypothetical protein [Allomuricauda sp.]MAU14020.1 hypothetical protein [Allomuricauda sp.]